MIALPAVALAVLLGRFLLEGSAIDLGPAACVVAPALLVLSAGWGLVSRSKLPDMADSLGLALLVPARGWLCDLSVSVWPLAHGGATCAALVSLGPVGYMLGRALSSLVKDGVAPMASGWIVGELLALVGGVGWMPGGWSGFVAAGLLAALVELGQHRRRHTDGGPVHPAWEALPLGVAFALLFVVVRRVAPGYADPGSHPGSSLALAYLVPAAVVLVPVRVLSRDETMRRALFAAGCLAFAFGAWTTIDRLDLHRLPGPGPRQTVTWAMHNRVWEHLGVLDPWWAWLLFFFVGLAAAGFGLLLGGLRRASSGPFVLGLGLGLLAESLVLVEPLDAPALLLLAATGLALSVALAAWRPKLAWLAPFGAAAALGVAPSLSPTGSLPGYDGIARVGEPTSEGFVRRLSADAVVTTAFGPRTAVRDSRRQYAETFTERVLASPASELDDLAARWTSEDAPVPGEFVLRPEADGHEGDLLVGEHDHDLDAAGDDGAGLGQRHYGLRVAGAPAHPGHDPLGVEGSLGRLQRLFGVRGPACVLGSAGELVAADLVDAGTCAPDAVALANAVPLTLDMTRVLLAAYDSAGYVGEADGDPRGWLAGREPARAATVVVAPERGAWPTATALLAHEPLEAMRALLRPGGRCLAWLDTSELDARALGARLAAFGAAFGERAAAFVEARGLDAPLVLLLGWVDDAGRPRVDEVSPALPWSERSGVRTRLHDLDDLAAMLLLDGPGLVRVADERAVHRRGRPVPANAAAEHGWGALAELLPGLPTPRLARVVAGAPDGEAPPLAPVAAGMAAHARYSFHLSLVRGSAMYEIVPDVDWAAFERESDAWAAAAADDPQHPLLHLALATLLETLAVEGDYTRFADVWQRVDGDGMASWRLQLLKAKVLREMLMSEEAWTALDRARELAGLPPVAR